MYLVLRTETFTKLFFLISCTGLFLYAVLAFYTFHTAYTSLGAQYSDSQDLRSMDFDVYGEIDKDLKYILVWTQSNDQKSSPEGQQIFTDHRCEFSNCFLTTNKKMLRGDYKNFDAIIFDISVVKDWKKINLPQSRSMRQKYIFYSMESSDDSPVCNVNVDNYFNWTWTYKLNSDIVSPFIEVTDLQGNVVAPKLNVNWTNNLNILEDKEIDAMKPKRKAAAMILEKCNIKYNKATLIKSLQTEFKMNLLEFDVYGCGNLNCSIHGCLKDIEKKYYFYLVHEDSFAEDYVTKEVIKAYHHDAVPIVHGGADYHRFLPDGSYIQVKTNSLDQLVAKVDYIIRNPYLYYSYFSWKKFYSIHETEEFRGICELCAYLNDEKKFGSYSVYKEFRKWWYPGSLYDRCIPRGAEELAEVLSYINSTVHLI
ncbi:alpha-(1,3)-fucosyltransferase C-like [Epargyreus clarus]|uniref:alpha-(1,3)-fucosyltransferase C-like n=1 Tax=Epargyreus clarus TaxID=520877 RepID=UPI003C2DDF16